jgi:hypothetical protein
MNLIIDSTGTVLAAPDAPPEPFPRGRLPGRLAPHPPKL